MGIFFSIMAGSITVFVVLAIYGAWCAHRQAKDNERFERYVAEYYASEN